MISKNLFRLTASTALTAGILACGGASYIWQQDYRGSDTEEVDIQTLAVTPDGRSVMTGAVTPIDANFPETLLTLSYGSDGSLLWANRWDEEAATGQSGNLSGRELTFDGNGNAYVISGSGVEELGLILIKIDPQGEEVWHKNWNGDFGNSKVAFHEGHIYLSSVNRNVSGGTQDNLWISKITSDGAQIWQDELSYRSLGVKDIDFTDGALLVTAMVDSQGFFAKWDLDGNRIWQKSVTETGLDFVLRETCIDADGDIYTVGNYLVEDGGEENTDAIVRKFDQDGNPLWQTRFALNDTSEEDARSIGMTNDMVFASALAGAGDSEIDAVMVGINPTSGELVWQHAFNEGFKSFDAAWDMTVTPAGNAVLQTNVVSLSTSPLSVNLYTVSPGGEILKTDKATNILGSGVAHDSAGNLWAAGVSTAKVGDLDKTVARIVKFKGL